MVHISGNSGLNSLTALNALVSIGSDLVIEGNDLLDALGLSHLASVGSSLRINDNGSLPCEQVCALVSQVFSSDLTIDTSCVCD